MGFNKIIKTAVAPARGTPAAFVPSTKAELKQYRKNGKKHERERAEAKEGRSRGLKMLVSDTAGVKYREMFERHDKFEIRRAAVFQKFTELVKENGMKLPRYREYLKPEDADGQFIFDVNYLLSHMTWLQLSQLINESVNRPVVTREYTEAFNFAAHALITLALKVADKKVRTD